MTVLRTSLVALATVVLIVTILAEGARAHTARDNLSYFGERCYMREFNPDGGRIDFWHMTCDTGSRRWARDHPTDRLYGYYTGAGRFPGWQEARDTGTDFNWWCHRHRGSRHAGVACHDRWG